MDTVCIGWTTIETREQAEALARGLLKNDLAACVQIDGPMVSHYRWKGKLERAEEYRLAVKFPEVRAKDIEEYLGAHHPYDTPQWVAVKASHCSANYAAWVNGKV